MLFQIAPIFPKVKFFSVLCFLIVMSGLGLAQQPRELGGRIENWPPYNWPQNMEGEVRLNFEGLKSATNLVTGEILRDGRFRLDLAGRYAVPAGAFRPLAQALILDVCSFTPSIVPASTRAAVAVLSVAVKNQTQNFGSLRMERRQKQNNREEAEISYLIYSDQNVQVSGSGRCGAPEANLSVSINDQIRRGWNIVTYTGDFGISESTVKITVRPAPVARFQVITSP